MDGSLVASAVFKTVVSAPMRRKVSSILTRSRFLLSYKLAISPARCYNFVLRFSRFFLSIASSTRLIQTCISQELQTRDMLQFFHARKEQAHKFVIAARACRMTFHEAARRIIVADSLQFVSRIESVVNCARAVAFKDGIFNIRSDLCSRPTAREGAQNF